MFEINACDISGVIRIRSRSRNGITKLHYLICIIIIILLFAADKQDDESLRVSPSVSSRLGKATPRGGEQGWKNLIVGV